MPTQPTPARPVLRRALVVGTGALAGLMMVTGALASRGTDLRPNRNTDLASLVQAEARRNEQLTRQLATLRTDVDDLSRRQAEQGGVPAAELRTAAEVAGASPVAGPAVTVTLRDAPLEVKPAGVDEDLLVVHQQDIQAVVDALWSGGAEAMTVQGQRVSSRTGLKCVGNTVVVHSVPYAPPYVITAIGDQAELSDALATSPALRIYRQYADAYRLGWDVRRQASVTMPAYTGPAEFAWAEPVR